MEATDPTHAVLLERLERMEAQLARQQATLDELLAHNRAQVEFIDEMRPVGKAIVDAGTETLGELEAKGYFAFGRSALRVVDKVVEGFGPEDVDALGDSVVSILDTVRAVTRPEVLALVQEGAEKLEEAEEAPPIGVIGLARASGDVNVQKGLGILVAALRHVGRASRVLHKKTEELRHGHADSSPATRARVSAAPRPVSAPPRPAPRPASVHADSALLPVFPEVAGVQWTSEGFLADAKAWTPELAEAIAADLGLSPLTERHWQAI